MQAQYIVPDPHFFRVQPDVFQASSVGLREREVFLDDARLSVLPGDFRCRQPGKGDKTAVVHNPFKLPDRFDELCRRFLVGYLLRYNPAPAEGGEVALSAASLPCRLCQEQVAVMVQERAFIEVPFKGAA